MLSQIPPISEKRLAVRVTPAAERALREGHPWLFEQAITKQSGDGRSGDIAVIFDRKGRFLAAGLYDPDSSIRVRVLQHQQPATINQAWFQDKLAAAARKRAPLLNLKTQTTGYRLVHGENDGLPGLVIDRYDNNYVMKVYTAVYLPHLHDLIEALTNAPSARYAKLIPQPYRIILRLSRDLAQQKDALFGLENGTVLHGPPLTGPIRFIENGLHFETDVVRGQKTGFFLDQRENRARVEQLAKDKTVLNVFAYTGGFSLYAARGGAKSVLSLDSSHPALNAAARNFDINPALANVPHPFLKGDAFEKLTELRDRGSRYDMVIIDPPSFAKSKAEIEGALAAYVRLVRLGLAVLEPGGTFVMASCSSRIEADDFFALVHRIAREERRPLREIARSTHPLDHPIGFKEGAYLKCLFAVAP